MSIAPTEYLNISSNIINRSTSYSTSFSDQRQKASFFFNHHSSEESIPNHLFCCTTANHIGGIRLHVILEINRIHFIPGFDNFTESQLIANPFYQQIFKYEFSCIFRAEVKNCFGMLYLYILKVLRKRSRGSIIIASIFCFMPDNIKMRT